MKKIISAILCLAMCFSLFGCKANKDVKAETVNTLADNTVVFFETDNDADCALLKHNNKYILIDSGEKKDAKKIAKFLLNNGIDTLDYIIFSHFDKDHCGGAIKMLKDIKVNKVLHPQYIKDSDETEKLFKVLYENGIESQAIDQKQVIDIDDLSLLFLPAEKQTYLDKESNNSSLVVKVTLLGKTILFTGDSQEERVAELISCNEDFNADILKLMYHGRAIANESELLALINPSYTIITGEKKNKKVKTNIENIKNNLGTYYFTSDGTIVFTITENDITVNQ